MRKAKVRTKPILRDVTICAADSVHPELAARALERSMDQCEFGDAILFSDRAVEGRFRNVASVRMTSIADYNRFCLKEMVEHITTPFVLVVQWDGYVVDGGQWSDSFKRYDYVGSPVPRRLWGDETQGNTDEMIVGNGGFSLRSRRFLDALTTLPIIAGQPEDRCISIIYRNTLVENFGLKFAPVKSALRFSHDLIDTDRKTFGFHGVYNLAKHESDDDVIGILERIDRNSYLSHAFSMFLLDLMIEGRKLLLLKYMEILKESHSREDVGKMLRREKFPPKIAAEVMRML